ncbi:MAG: IclR family transcriptional regulator [Tardiphaga sp.]
MAYKKTALLPGRKDHGTRPAAADGSSRKVLRALLAFSIDKPRHSAESLAEQIGLPLSSTYRYIGILREAELIDEDGRGSFVLAPRVIGLAQAARAGTDLASIARPYMKRVAQEAGETLILIRRSGDRAVCIERVESSSRIRLTFEVGTALPLHRGAGPKLLLAHLPTEECEALLEEAAARDPTFAAQRKSLQRELAVIREQGWAESRAEITPHVYAASVGVHDANGVVAALSFVAPAFRMPRASQIKLREYLQQAASDITRAYAAVTF